MIPNAKPKPEKYSVKVEFDVGFPQGSLAEVVAYLTEVEQENLNTYKNNCSTRNAELGYEIVKTYFTEQWHGYEDCYYYFVIVVEEKEEIYQARLSEWKQLEKERLEAKAKIKAVREEAERITKIKELEEQLNKLKGVK